VEKPDLSVSDSAVIAEKKMSQIKGELKEDLV